MTSVDSILALSDVPNPAKYRHYLEGLPEKKRGELLEDLKKDAAEVRPVAPGRRWRPGQIHTREHNFNWPAPGAATAKFQHG